MAPQTIIYHNPRCTKSRETLALLEKKGEKPQVVEYLKNPLSYDALKNLSQLLGLRPKDFLRKKEDIFSELKIDAEDDEAVLKAMAKHPVLMERPIVVRGKKAAIGRPPEAVLPLLK